MFSKVWVLFSRNLSRKICECQSSEKDALAHLLDIIGVMLLSKIKKLNIINGCNYAEEIRGYLCLCLVVVKQSKINQIKINLHLGKGVDQMKSF